ncbi:hypothetical protein H0H93_006803 [Arthromyces matolae]|nr:hypothetical protein H0H93_006803 [Arthromyces matolae]
MDSDSADSDFDEEETMSGDEAVMNYAPGTLPKSWDWSPNYYLGGPVRLPQTARLPLGQAAPSSALHLNADLGPSRAGKPGYLYIACFIRLIPNILWYFTGMEDPGLVNVVPVLKTIGATLVALGVYKGLRLAYGELTSPLRDLPGPYSPSWIFGNVKELRAEEPGVPQERWVEQYGPTIKYQILCGIQRLFTMDTKAINHVLMNTNIYQKPESTRYNLGRIVGEGVLVVEGDKHRQQRKVMNPAFGPAHIRELTEIFTAKSVQLRDIWASQIANEESSVGRIEVLSWLSRATLDIIGLAGFNYEFDALNDHLEENELNAAFASIFRGGTTWSVALMLKALFPPLRFLRTSKDKEIAISQTTMNRIAHQLLRESKISAQDKSTTRSRDLLSLLVQSNMATDIPAHQRMSDEDVIAQVPTFLVAGHETTSTGTTWALFALSQDMAVQTKLRNELLAVETDYPTMDELNALPYLDMVVRETLRVHAPVPATMREAMQDDILPLSKPFRDRNGILQTEIRVKKGQTIQIPILAMNRSKEIWGEDAKEFRPERWESPPKAAANIPGVWGHLLSFIGGPRACIGYRFSLVEMKALLFTLVRAFEFELAVPVSDISRKSAIVQRPIVLSDPKGGNQMPLLVRPYYMDHLSKPKVLMVMVEVVLTIPKVVIAGYAVVTSGSIQADLRVR